MASVVDLCNRALDLLGAANITSLTENSKEARLCNGNFDDVRDAVLRSHPWNIAITRRALARDTDTPAFGFSFQYSLPTDPFCLRVLSFWNSNVNNDKVPGNNSRSSDPNTDDSNIKIIEPIGVAGIADDWTRAVLTKILDVLLS